MPGVLLAFEGSFMLWIGRPRRLSRALQGKKVGGAKEDNINTRECDCRDWVKKVQK